MVKVWSLVGRTFWSPLGLMVPFPVVVAVMV